VAAQVQSRVVATVSVPGAPAAGTELIELLTFTAHFVEEEGPVTSIDVPVHPAAAAAESAASRKYSRARIRASRMVQALCPAKRARPHQCAYAQPFTVEKRARFAK
jgi:hypothetical protein